MICSHVNSHQCPLRKTQWPQAVKGVCPRSQKSEWPNQHHGKTLKRSPSQNLPSELLLIRNRQIVNIHQCEHTCEMHAHSHVCMNVLSVVLWYLKLSCHTGGYYGSTGWGTSNRIRNVLKYKLQFIMYLWGRGEIVLNLLRMILLVHSPCCTYPQKTFDMGSHCKVMQDLEEASLLLSFFTNPKGLQQAFFKNEFYSSISI